MQNENNILNDDILNNLSFENNEEISDKSEDILSIVTENITSEPIILKNIEEETGISDFLREIEVEVEKELEVEKKENKIIGTIIFLFKYILTSGTIFAVLLLASNYSAYVEIAKSYLNPEGLEITKNSMYASINGSSIVNSANGANEESIEQKISQEQKMDMVKNKTYHSMEKLVGYNKEIPIDIDMAPYENRVIIPKIGKNIPLVDVEQRTVHNVKELEDVFMKELVNGIVRYPGSAKPGQEGNAFIFGHSSNFPWLEGKYNDVFALLDNVAFGDEVIVYYGQKKYTYKISEKKIIKPGDTSVLKRETGKKEISLMTCWPVGTTLNRMIVIGELVEEK